MSTKLYSTRFKQHPARMLAAVILVVLFTFGDLAAQQEPAATPTPAQETQETPKVPNDQLDSMVAPIALYPDPLLSQVLVSSTYPLELVQLQQWLEKTGKMLNEKAVTEAVQKENWDPSVQAMAVLPEVVRKLVENIKWTTELGNAFLAQQTDVMEAVQRMRVKAKDAGKLKSSDQIKVETKQVENTSYVFIEQASPEVVYVPNYDPAWIWGAMAYPYPYWYGGYYGGAAIWYGAGIAMGAAWAGGWGWGAGWGNNNINMNINNRYVNHYNNSNINRGGDRINSGNWQHNPQHRGGAPYGNRATQQRFGGNNAGNRQAGNLGSGARAGNMDLSGLRGGGSNLGANRGSLGGGAGQAGNLNLSGLRGSGPTNIGANRGSMGGDRIGNRSVSGGYGQRNGGSFGGSGSFGGGAARSSSMRGASSMGGGGYGGGGGMRGGGGGMRGGGGGRRR